MAQSYLLVINDGPYGSEKAYNALRLALSLLKLPESAVHVFLLGDGASCAAAGQETPQGYYNIERMLHSIASRGAVYT
ncbi:MAG: DsrE family protein [Thermodesulfobacteriota bacterium]